MNVFEKFGGGDCGKEETRTYMSKKEITGADIPSSDHVSHAVSNSAKNISNYLTPGTKRAFDQLYQAFTKAPILQHFNPERYIWVKTDAFGYAIGGVLSQPINDLGRWHPIAYFLRKMIPVKIQYKTYNSKLLAIIEVFKTWQHYLKSCRHKVLIFTNYKNF